MTFKIREFSPTESEYAAIVAIINATYPEFPTTVEQMQHEDRSLNPDYLFQRLVAEVDGQIVAVGTYFESPWFKAAGNIRTSLTVHPDFRQQGIGSACYDRTLADLQPRQPSSLVARARDDQAAGIRFLEQRGFKQVEREPRSTLKVNQFDPKPFAPITRRVQEAGIRIVSVAELMETDPDWKRKMWELDGQVSRDIPSHDPIEIPPLEQYEKDILGAFGFMPTSYFIALDGDQIVGMSGLLRDAAGDDRLYTELTGVHRDYRRQGIATALKLRCIAFAEDYGATEIITTNEETNPMYTLNLRLGFTPLPSWLTYEKVLTAPHAD